MSDFSKANNWADYPKVRQEIDWHTSSGKDGVVFVAEREASVWMIRINDFPEEPLYTLLIDGEEILHFDDWPNFWIQPELP
jgi:hypothetical protein